MSPLVPYICHKVDLCAGPVISCRTSAQCTGQSSNIPVTNAIITEELLLMFEIVRDCSAINCSVSRSKAIRSCQHCDETRRVF
jgi:hypothetical protein